MNEKRIRSMLKTITWRIIASSITFSLVYVFTGQLIISLGVGLFEVVSKLISYYLHERIWNGVKWGKS
jgi:uncharacterized membrane protein